VAGVTRRGFALGALGLATTGLGACSLGRSAVQKLTNDKCPKIRVLGDAREISVFRPGPSGGVDLVYEARLTARGRGCSMLGGHQASGGPEILDAGVKLTVVADRAPAARISKVKIPYFVAAVAPDNTVVGKRVFELEADFGGGRRVTLEEAASARIPLYFSKDQSIYKIVVGFQLTPRQLAYNRQRRNF